MANQDVLLRIRAKNLASKDLAEISKALDQITKAQDRQKTSAGLAATSISELKDEQRQLVEIAKELASQKNLLATFNKQREALSRLSQQAADARAKLKALNDQKATTPAGIDAKKLGAEIKRAETALKGIEAQGKSAVAALEKTDKALFDLGISSKNAAKEEQKLTQAQERTQSLLKGTTAAIDTRAAAVEKVNVVNREAATREREVAQEVARRAAVEKAAQEASLARIKSQIAETARLNATRITPQTSMFNTPEFASQDKARRQQQFQDSGFGRLVANENKLIAQQAAATERLAGIEKRYQSVIQRNAEFKKQYGTASRQLVSELQREASALDRTTAATRRASQAQGLFSDTGRKSLSVYQRLRGQILQVAAAYVGLYQAADLVTKSVQVSQKRQAIETQITVANNGDEKKTAADLKFLRQEADRLGLSYTELAQRFANFKISGKAVGLTTKEINTAFTQAAVTVTGLRLSADDADGVFRAFVQILGKARVQAEELRGQLGDRLPGAVAEFAKANNIALKDLDKFLKAGKGNVSTFLKFLEAYAQKFDATLPKTTKTLLADLNRLKTAYDDFLVVLATSGTNDGLQKVINQLSTFFKGQDGKKFAKQLGEAFAGIAEVLLFVIKNFDTFLSLLKLFLALQAAKAVNSLATSFFGLLRSLTGIPAVLRATAIQLVAMSTAQVGATAASAGLIGSLKALRVGLTVAAAGTGALAIASRALLFAMGPIGIAIAVVTTGLIYLANRETQAEKAAKAHHKVLGELTTTYQKNYAEGQRLAAQRREEAAQRLDIARAALAEARAIAAASTARALGQPDRKGAVLQARNDSTKLAELENQVEAATLEVARIDKVLIAGAQARIARILAEDAAATETRVDLDVSAEEDANKEKEAAAARLAAAKLRITEQLADAISAIDRDLARTEKDNLLQRLTLIDVEIDKRVREINALRDQALKNGQPAEAEGFKKLASRLEILRAIQKEEATELFGKQQIELAEKAINDELERRAQLLRNIETLAKLGAPGFTTQDQVAAKVNEVTIESDPKLEALRAAMENLIITQGKIFGPEWVAAAQLSLQTLTGTILSVTTKLTDQQKFFAKFGEEITGGIANGVGVLAKGIAGALQGANSLSDAFKNAGAAFANFAADFLIKISQMIIQALLLKAISNFISGEKGGYGSAVKSIFTQHTGGIAGDGSNVRRSGVSPLVFAGAQRFHEGGLPGLKNNEVATILKKGEEVVTEDNPRHIGNQGGGGAASQPIDLTVNNSVDSVQVLSAGLRRKDGRVELQNAITADAPTYRKILGVK